MSGPTPLTAHLRACRRRLDRGDDCIQRGLEVPGELCFRDAPDEPPDGVRRVVADGCRGRHPRRSDAPGGRRSRAPTGGRGWRCRTGHFRSPAAAPRAGGPCRRRLDGPARRSTRRSHSDSAGAPGARQSEHVEEPPHPRAARGVEPFAPFAAASPRVHSRRARAVLEQRAERDVVEVAGHVDDGPRRAGQPDAVRAHRRSRRRSASPCGRRAPTARGTGGCAEAR